MSNKKLPALQFYTGDWRKDPCVQALDHEHKGVWIDLLCILNETSERGRLVLPNGNPMPDDAAARNLGVSVEKWKQMRSKLISLGVASEDENGVLYNRRIVRDQAIRDARAEAGRKGGKKSRPKQGQSKPEARRGSSVAVSTSASASTPTPTTREEAFGSLDGTAVKAIKGLYGWPPGEEGTDPKVWKGGPPVDRGRCIAIAVQRLEGEGREYQGKLFRRILETVIDEQRDAGRRQGGRAPGTPRREPEGRGRAAAPRVRVVGGGGQDRGEDGAGAVP